MQQCLNFAQSVRGQDDVVIPIALHFDRGFHVRLQRIEIGGEMGLRSYPGRTDNEMYIYICDSSPALCTSIQHANHASPIFLASLTQILLSGLQKCESCSQLCLRIRLLLRQCLSVQFV